MQVTAVHRIERATPERLNQRSNRIGDLVGPRGELSYVRRHRTVAATEPWHDRNFAAMNFGQCPDKIARVLRDPA